MTYIMIVNDLRKMYQFNGLGKPNDIAKLAVILASDDASQVASVCLPVDGGYTALQITIASAAFKLNSYWNNTPFLGA